MPMGNAQSTKPRSVAHHSLSNIRPLQYRPFFYGFLILRSRFAQKLNIPKKFLGGRRHENSVSVRHDSLYRQTTHTKCAVTSSFPRSQVFQRAANKAAPMLKHACGCAITPCRRQLPKTHDSYPLIRPEASCPCLYIHHAVCRFPYRMRTPYRPAAESACPCSRIASGSS